MDDDVDDDVDNDDDDVFLCHLCADARGSVFGHFPSFVCVPIVPG